MRIDKVIIAVPLFILCTTFSYGQSLKKLADSVRKVYRIPELGYAVVSADKVYELDVAGYKKAGTNRVAEKSDLFRIGSNTKAITGFIAAELVKQGKISWSTKFFDQFPEMKAHSRKEYWDLTLLDLLSLRTKLFSYTYTYAKPVKGQFKGTEEQQRYQFATWFFKQEPVVKKDVVNFSNLGYVAAGLMMEKVTGKSYRELTMELGKELDMDIHFGRPNNISKLQTWGHTEGGVPEQPGDDFKLNWLLPAGNVTLSLPDYVKFIQLQLQGLQGRSTLLTAEEFNFIHFGLPRFSVGWFADKDEHGHTYSYNIGNPGSFLTSVYVYKDIDLAFILFANIQSEQSEEGLSVLYEQMKRTYVK
ncbi:MAG: beta-lactamase [Flavipsychrobacter sp.]|nr:beta-lactamase [Flavipsychrobacter sp.]